MIKDFFNIKIKTLLAPYASRWIFSTNLKDIVTIFCWVFLVSFLAGLLIVASNNNSYLDIIMVTNTEMYFLSKIVTLFVIFLMPISLAVGIAIIICLAGSCIIWVIPVRLKNWILEIFGFNTIVLGMELSLRLCFLPWLFGGISFDSTPENPLFEEGDLPGGGSMGPFPANTAQDIGLRNHLIWFGQKGAFDIITPDHTEVIYHARALGASFSKQFIDPQIDSLGLHFEGKTYEDRECGFLYYYWQQIHCPRHPKIFPDEAFEHFKQNPQYHGVWESYGFKQKDFLTSARPWKIGHPDSYFIPAQWDNGECADHRFDAFAWMYSQMPRELKERVTSSGLVTHETDDIIKKYILHSLWADAQEHRSRSTTLFQAVCSDHIHRDIAWVSRTRNMYRVVTENLIVGPELVEGRMYPTWTPIDITVAPPPVVGGRMYPTWNPSERNVAPSAVKMQ